MCKSYKTKKKSATEKIRPILEEISKRERNLGSLDSGQLRKEIADSMSVKDYSNLKDQVESAVNCFESVQV